MQYHTDSAQRLSTEHEKLLQTLLKNWVAKYRDIPVIVTDGYELHATHSGDDCWKLIVGRNRLYEKQGELALLERFKQRDSLRALYFPGATPSDELLFQTTLYFDTMFILHPGSSVFRNRARPYDEDTVELEDYKQDHSTFLERLSEFDKRTEVLKLAGVLNPLLPSMQETPNFPEYIRSDLLDQSFCECAEVAFPERAFIAARKMESLLPVVGDGLESDATYKDIVDRANYHGSRRETSLLSDRAYGLKQVNGILSASILLNHAVLLAAKNDLVPVTDNELARELLGLKMNRVAKNEGVSEYRKELTLKSSSLAMRVLEFHLPKFDFASHDDALRAREKLEGPLVDFRTEIAALSVKIENEPYSENFAKEIDDITLNQIRPAVQAMEKEIRTSKDSFVSRVLKNAQTGSIPIAATLFVGLPPEAVLAISAGVLTVEAALNTYQKIEQAKMNGFSVLLGKAAT